MPIKPHLIIKSTWTCEIGSGLGGMLNFNVDKEKESAIKQSTAEEHWSFSRGRWTEEEHRLYLNGFEEHGKKWEKIANAIKTRTLSQVKAYGHRHLKEQVDMKFSKKAGEEDFTSKEVKSCIR